jgi:hypothetical protein
MDKETAEVVEEQPQEDQQVQEPEQAPEPEEVVVSIGEEESPPQEQERAPDWVRELRKQHREAQRKIREYEARLSQQSQPQVTLGQKPKLEDYDYDADKFEQALDSWFERKRHVDELNAKAKQAEEAQKASWEQKLSNYGKAKAGLKVQDFEDAEETVLQNLNVVQQGVILQGAENPALVVYALGSNPAKAKELSEIKDPVKFAFAVAKLEKDLKVTQRRAPPPEKTVVGSARSTGAVDSTLERLRADAERTGDYSKVVAYRRQQRSK